MHAIEYWFFGIMTNRAKLVFGREKHSGGRSPFRIGHPLFFVLTVFVCCFNTPSAGVSQMTIAGLVGQEIELPCTMDASKCGELHSIKWYKGTTRIFVFSESANIAKSEGDFADRAELLYDQNATRTSLRIKPLRVTDEALYKCDITYIKAREECPAYQLVNVITRIKPEYLRISRSDESEVQNSSLIGPYSEGNQFSLLCESGGGKPVPVVEWWNGTSQINGDKQMESHSDGIGTGRNKIKVIIGRGDLGAKFECRAKNDALDEPMVSWVELDVNVRPLKMILTGIDHHVVQGAKVLLQCIVHGARPAAKVTWYNGTEVMSEEFVSTTSAVKADGTYETQSSLQFTASRYENGGLITCEAINSVMIEKDESPMKSTLTLEVLYPPIVYVEPVNVTVNESSDILLTCTYEANPSNLLSVKWLRDGVQVETDSERYVDGTPERPNLLIKNSTRHDQGTYTCICENEVGSTESTNSIYINVLYKPTVKVVIDPPPPVNEIDKVNVLVICDIVAGNPEVLQVVRWYLNGTLLRELPECSPDNDTFCDIDPSHLLLEPAIRDLHGNYSCEGMNEAGWGPLSEAAEFVVYYPPGPATLRYEPQRVIKGKPVNLLCLVEDLGRPPSDTYRWVRGTHLIQDVTSYNWTMESVTLETEANFTCSAYNLGGEGQSSSTSIEVLAPPAFIERLPPYYGALMSAQFINISCRVECSPLCTVSWLKNGRPIEKTAGSSTLYSVKNLVVPADPSTNDFNSVQSTLMWDMNAWPGGQLDRLYDNANYTCQSTGNIVGGGVRSTTFFGVEYPPENITLSTKVISVVEGQEMQEKVTCQAKAYPEASYLWRKEGETETITKGNVFMLRYQVPRKDGGNYVCEAYNRHGNVTGTTFLNVLFKPECAITQTEQNGKPVLVCTAHANPTDVNFMWKIKNENETVEDFIEDKGLQSFLILESRIENFRTYLCFANNSVGMSIPCERDVTGKASWWPMFDNDNLLIIIAVIVGAILMFLVVCVIIILVCRKKRAEDKCEKKVTAAEKLGLHPTGSRCDGLDDRAFYENLPFHGMQNPPTKSGFAVKVVNDAFAHCLEAAGKHERRTDEGLALRRAKRRLAKSNTFRVSATNAEKPELVFHSLRIYKKGERQPLNGFAKIQSTSSVLLESLEPSKTPPPENFKNSSFPKDESSRPKLSSASAYKTEEPGESFREVGDKTPLRVPDRMFKPKFFNGKFKWRSTEGKPAESDDSFLNNDDNESLISGIERLSNSPAPVPAPRKLVTSSVTKSSTNVKHTYQNVPIPISPNNTMDTPPEDEKSLEARHYKLTSSQQHLIPTLSNKRHSHQAAYNLLQNQSRVRHSGKRGKHDTNCMRNTKKVLAADHPPGYTTINGSLRQNELFFNTLRDANKHLGHNDEDDSDYQCRAIKSDSAKPGKDFRERARERLKDTTPLQVMRFKELLTAGGENYNRQSNSDSSGEKRGNTDSSSGDADLPISDSRHFRNISSGEESLLRNSSKSSYVTIPGDHEIFRPIPINSAKLERPSQTNSLERSESGSQRTYVSSTTLPVQSLYTPMSSDPLLVPQYVPLGSDLTPNSEPLMLTEYDGVGVGLARGDLSTSDCHLDDLVASENAARTVQIRNSRNSGSEPKRNVDFGSLTFWKDVGHEIDV